MAQLIMCLIYKHKDPSSVSWQTLNKLAMAQVSIIHTGEVETDPGGLLAS